MSYWLSFSGKLASQLINRSLLPFGYQFTRVSRLVSPVHKVSDLNGIVSLKYENPNRDLILLLPLEKGCGSPLYSWGKHGSHPFIGALQRALSEASKNERRVSISSDLHEYFSEFAPKDFSELLGLPFRTSPNIARLKPWEGPLPWEPLSQSKSRQTSFGDVAGHEGFQHGFRLTIEDGWTWCGPVSRKKLALETKRLGSLLERVERHGFRRSNLDDGDIKGVILAKETGDWVWQSFSGQHRAAVLSALGHEVAPVRVSNIIWVDEAVSWPWVVSGEYSLDDALAVFDRVFSGASSSA